MILKEQIDDLLSVERDAIISILYETPYYNPDKSVKKKILQVQRLAYEMLNRTLKKKKLSYLESAYQKVYEDTLRRKSIIQENFSPESLKKMLIFYLTNDALQNSRAMEKSHMLLKSKNHAKILLIENILLPVTIFSDTKEIKDINFNSKIDTLRKLIAELVIEAS